MKILLISTIVFFAFIFNVSTMMHLQAFGDNLISQKYPNMMKLSIQSSPDQLNLIPPQDRQIHLKFFDTNTTNPVRDVTFVMIVTKGNQTFLQNTFWTQSGSFTLNLKPGERYLWTANPDHDPMDGLYYSKGDQIDIWTSHLTDDVYYFSIQPVVVNQNDLRQQNVGGKFMTDLNLLSTYNETLAPNVNIVSSINPMEISSPLKQFKSGVTTQNIVCKDGFVLAIKKHGHQPACVNPDAIPKLVLRGWSENPLDGLLLKYGNQTQANLVFYDVMNEQKIRDWSMKGWRYSDYNYASNGETGQSSATIHLYLPSNIGTHECENGSYGIVVVNLKPIEIEHNYTEVGCGIVTTTAKLDPQSNGMYGTLSGIVSLAGGPANLSGPKSNYEVDVYTADGTTVVGKTFSDANAHYSMQLPAGNYTVYVPDYPDKQTHFVSVFSGKNTTFNIAYGTGYK